MAQQQPYLSDQQVLGQTPETADLSRQRRIAELLMTQATEQPQGQMISGHYVAPSWSQQIAPLAKAAIGTGLSQSLDAKQVKLAEALRGKQAEQIQQYGELEKTDKAAALRFALSTDNPILRDIAKEELKGIKLGKGDVFTRTSLGGGVTKMEGAPDIPDAIQYAISVGGLPANPSTWNDQQRAMAKQLIESKSKAGAGGNIYNQIGKSIASEVGPIMKEAQGVAQAAVKTEDSANRIIQAVDSNKLFTGSGANVRFGVAQLANTLGVGGATLEAKIANTRQTMQGLAELTLQGRQQMRGQGAITESESKLAERAISGEITFTPTEIKQLANAAKRSADYTYNSYQSKIGEMSKNPDTASLVPYYQVQKMTPSNAMPDQSAIDAEIARRQGKR
jgi:hypothetical protein